MKSDISVAVIHRVWHQAASKDEAAVAVRWMIHCPSVEWRHYLDCLYLARRYGRGDTPDDYRLQALADLENDVYGAVAEAISRANGVENIKSP